MSNETLRKLSIALLTNDNGITGEAYAILREELAKDFEANKDIILAVEATDDSFYLPDGWDSEDEDENEG